MRAYGITELAGRAGHGYLVLAPLTGRPLGELLAEQGRIGWRRALAVAEQVCTALVAVHAAGLVHGCLQPASVLIDDAGAEVVTLLDAGLAGFAPAADAEEAAPAAGGALYLAPEHGDGAPAEYTSDELRRDIRRLRLRQSMGRTGSCYDNAAAESFFAVLKEEIGTREWPDRATARAEIFTFIETFYNRKRLRKHPTWGYLTPLETRQRHERGHTLAA